jgi:hypothetical protein
MPECTQDNKTHVSAKRVHVMALFNRQALAFLLASTSLQIKLLDITHRSEGDGRTETRPISTLHVGF